MASLQKCLKLKDKGDFFGGAYARGNRELYEKEKMMGNIVTKETTSGLWGRDAHGAYFDQANPASGQVIDYLRETFPSMRDMLTPEEYRMSTERALA